MLTDLRTLLRDPHKKVFTQADLETFIDHGLMWFNTAEPPTVLTLENLQGVGKTAVLWAAAHLACKHAIDHHIELDPQDREDYEELAQGSKQRFGECKSIKWALVRNSGV